MEHAQTDPRREDTFKEPAPAPVDTVNQEQVRMIVRAMRTLDVGNGKLRAKLAHDLGIGVTELNAMAYLKDAGDLAPKQMGQQLSITTGSVTPMIDRLEAAGFLTRQKNPADRRSLLLHLTPSGDHAMRWVYEHFADAVTSTTANTTAEAAAQLTTFLDNTAQALNEAADH